MTSIGVVVLGKDAAEFPSFLLVYGLVHPFGLMRWVFESRLEWTTCRFNRVPVRGCL
jgi:hypothetical protein